MNLENHTIFQHYIKLTEFLGRTLGPDYEIVLHSMENQENAIIAIANNHVSGQELGAPLAREVLQMIEDKSYHDYSYRLHYMGVSGLGKRLRSSTLFIENQSEELIGLLSINFDDSKFLDLAKCLIGLCHPDTFVETNFHYDEAYKETRAGLSQEGSGFRRKGAEQSPASQGEPFAVPTERTVHEALGEILREMDLEGKKLSQAQRISVMEHLEHEGMFLLKGAARSAAEGLGISQASVYRYLAEIRKEQAGPLILP